jgi:hypothetical protein
MKNASNNKVPRGLQQAAQRLADAIRAHAEEREQPYDKWRRFDAKQAEYQVREAYDAAKREHEYMRSGKFEEKKPAKRRRPSPPTTWYRDQHGNLIVRRQPRRKPNVRPA